MTALPAWAEWNEHGAGSPWTVGIEEEVMLIEPDKPTTTVAPTCVTSIFNVGKITPGFAQAWCP